MDDIIPLFILIFAAGLLYSSVGHAGASGYLAAMALFGLAPEAMKPTALVLNIIVAIIATVQFYRVGSFSWSIFWPFAAGSIPFAFIGGAIPLPGATYKLLVGFVLLFAACRLFQYSQSAYTNTARPAPVTTAIVSGAAIGLLSGAIGVGGGIFLSPLLLFMGWAQIRQTAGISAPFILVNSTAGIAGHLVSINYLPDDIYPLIFAAILGGIIGSYLGSRMLADPTFYCLLAVILAVAGAKLILGA